MYIHFGLEFTSNVAGDYKYTYYQNKMFIYKNDQINDRNDFNIDNKLFICLFSKSKLVRLFKMNI